MRSFPGRKYSMPASTHAARRLRQLLAETSPLIEAYTSAVCPACTDVCCRQRHGLFTVRDRAYLSALGAEAPLHDPSHPLDGPCQFLGPGGCAKPRWQRAWKCTWYFCEPLLQALETGPPKQARALSASLEEMTRLYDAMEED
jgi:hypothetical protein